MSTTTVVNGTSTTSSATYDYDDNGNQTGVTSGGVTTPYVLRDLNSPHNRGLHRSYLRGTIP